MSDAELIEMWSKVTDEKEALKIIADTIEDYADGYYGDLVGALADMARRIACSEE